MPTVSALVISALLLFDANALAQERELELQSGVGFVLDSGEGPSAPAINIGVVGWLTRAWGVGGRLTEGLTDDSADSPGDVDERLLGTGDMRMWAITSQWRWISRGVEVNAGVGVGGHGFRIKSIRMGRVSDIRSGSAFIALDLLVGRRLAGPLHIKGGFTYGLAGDLHPFQPVVIVAWKP